MRKAIRGTTRGLEEAARAVRRQATGAEDVLWGALQKKRVAGLKFRRQHAVGRLILDFYCPSLKLVVKVDGEVHNAQHERNEERTRAMETHGYRVLRFRNKMILNDLPVVVGRIAACAADVADAQKHRFAQDP